MRRALPYGSCVFITLVDSVVGAICVMRGVSHSHQGSSGQTSVSEYLGLNSSLIFRSMYTELFIGPSLVRRVRPRQRRGHANSLHIFEGVRCLRKRFEVLAVVLVGLGSQISHVSPRGRMLGGPARGFERT